MFGISIVFTINLHITPKNYLKVTQFSPVPYAYCINNGVVDVRNLPANYTICGTIHLWLTH